MISLAGRQFRSPGPIASAFMADRVNKVRAILGPQGGGKTVSCVHDLVTNAAYMPVCRDGAIHFRVAAIRDTYDRLEKTTIKTWLEWFPKDAGVFEGGGGRSASHKLNFKTVRDGREVPVQFEIIFAAIGDQAAEDFMRGFEVTAFWLNEMDLLAEDVLTFAIGRVGRYPAVHQLPDGAEYRRFIIGDLNAPDIDSWFYRRFEEDRPEGFKLYRQPSGRSPRAENLHNLVAGYYDEQLKLNASKPKWIKRFIDAEYGPTDAGEPVYPEYSDDIHLAREPLRPVKGIPLELGVDAGVQRPACIIGQTMPNGQDRILGEVIPGRCGVERFANAVKREIQELAELAGLQTLEIGSIYGDPWGFTGADKEAGELAWMERLAIELGCPVLPTETNEIEPRLDAVRDDLSYMIDGNTPALLVSPRCKVLRKGFASHYCFAKQKTSSGERTADKPDKTNGSFSDIHDALQYKKLGKKGRWGVVGGGRRHKRDTPDDGRTRKGQKRNEYGPGTTVIKDGGSIW